MENQAKQSDVHSRTASVVPERAGQKVLMRFRAYLGMRGENNPALHASLQQEVEAALREAGMAIVDSGQLGAGPCCSRMFERMWLIDAGQRPHIATARNLPYFGGAIVFQYGRYREGLPIAQIQTWEEPYRGKVPLAFGCRAWSARDAQDGTRENELKVWRAMESVHVEVGNPPSGSGGSGGWAKLSPGDGATLLEVFLQTGADFCFEDPGVATSAKP